MTQSSAKPANLREYSTGAVAADDELPPRAGTLDAALDAFRSSETDAEFLPYLPAFGATIRALAERGRHTDEWVGDVARAFEEAGQSGHHLWPEGYHLADDSALDALVGQADRAESVAEGQEHAEELEELVERANAGDEEAIEAYAEIEALMAEMGGNASDEAYSEALMSQLGTDGITDVTRLIANYGYLDGGEGQPLAGLDSETALGVPFSEVFAAASREGIDDIEADLLAIEDGGRTALAVLLISGNAQPEFTAGAAGRLLPLPEDHDAQHELTYLLAQYDGTPSAQEYALLALARSDAAAFAFASASEENLSVLLRPYEHLLAVQGSEDPEQLAADALEGGLIHHPAADPTADPDQAIAWMVQDVGDGDIPDVIKRSAARVGVTAYDHIATNLHETSTVGNPPPGLEGVSEEDLEKFFQELSYDDTAAQIAVDGAVAFMRHEVSNGLTEQVRVDGELIPGTATSTETSRVGELFGTIGEGMALGDIDEDEQRQLFRDALNRVSAMVEGAALASTPLTGPWGPIAAGVIEGGREIAVNQIDGDGVDEDDVYRESLEAPLTDAIARTIYENPDARRALEDIPPGEPLPDIPYEEWLVTTDGLDDAVDALYNEVTQQMVDEIFETRIYDD